MREREGLIARIRQIRGTAAAPAAPAPRGVTDDASGLQTLSARVGHLEQLLEALQDSVHRESERNGRRISDLEAAVQPAALTIALNRDARERGL